MSHKSSKFPWRRGNPLPSERGAVKAERLAVESPDGIATVRSGLTQLEKYGYLRRYRLRDQTGKLRGARWVITDDPDSIRARIAELAEQVGEEGLDLFQRKNTSSEPKCDFPTLENPPVENRMTKKTSTTEEEGRQEGAHTRKTDPSTNDVDDQWGVAPSERPAAERGTLLARTFITQIAEETGLGLEPWQHKRLVLEHLPTALDAVRDLDDDRISPTELLEWLRADHDTTMSLYAVLSRRCNPDYLAQALPIRVARNRIPGGLPAPRRAAPLRSGGAQGHDTTPDPFTRAGAPTTCLVHPGIALTADATGRRTRCHMCENISDTPWPEQTAQPTPEGLIDLLDQTLVDRGPNFPKHCGNRSCHEQRRHIICYNPRTRSHQDLGPCLRCHPARAQQATA